MTRKKTPAAIVRRERVLKILRKARDYADALWVKEGRKNLRDNHFDLLEKAYTEIFGGGHCFVPRVMPKDYGLTLGYMCRVIYRNNDPGTNWLREKMLYKYGQGCSCQHRRRIHEAVLLVMEDLKEIRAKEREKGRKAA